MPANKPKQEFSKKDSSKRIKSAAERKAAADAREKEAFLRLAKASGTEGLSKWAQINRVTQIISRGTNAVNPAGEFYFLTDVFSRFLRHEVKSAVSVPDLWKLFVSSIDAIEQSEATKFALNFENEFRWILIGHVQQLALNFEATPLGLHEIRIYEDLKDSNKTHVVAVRNDGEQFEIGPEHYFEHPQALFPGDKRIFPPQGDLMPDRLELPKGSIRPSHSIGGAPGQEITFVNVGFHATKEELIEQLRPMILSPKDRAELAALRRADP